MNYSTCKRKKWRRRGNHIYIYKLFCMNRLYFHTLFSDTLKIENAEVGVNRRLLLLCAYFHFMYTGFQPGCRFELQCMLCCCMLDCILGCDTSGMHNSLWGVY